MDMTSKSSEKPKFLPREIILSNYPYNQGYMDKTAIESNPLVKQYMQLYPDFIKDIKLAERTYNNLVEFLEFSPREVLKTLFRPMDYSKNTILLFLDSGEALSTGSSKYKNWMSSLQNLLKQKFKPQEGPLSNVGTMVDVDGYFRNDLGKISFPLQIPFNNSVNSDRFRPTSELARVVHSSILCSMFTKPKLESYSIPKDSNSGPFLFTSDMDIKIENFIHLATNIDRINELYADFYNPKNQRQLISQFDLSGCGKQGLRYQNERHSVNGKSRGFLLNDKQYKTMPHYDTVTKGYFGVRPRLVKGISQTINALANIILNSHRNHYYQVYKRTFKIIDIADLNETVERDNFFTGSDFEQMDANIANHRVEMLLSKAFEVVNPKYSKMFSILAKQLARPTVFYSPIVRGAFPYIEGRVIFGSEGELNNNTSNGLESGLAVTSEAGKVDGCTYIITNFLVGCKVQSKLSQSKLNRLVQEVYEALPAYFIKQPISQKYAHDAYPYISNIDNFVHNFLSNNLDRTISFKNMGDDVYLGATSSYESLVILCRMVEAVIAVKHGKELSSKLMLLLIKIYNEDSVIKQAVDSFSDDFCEWHLTDCEEPIMFTGRVLMLNKNRDRVVFQPNPLTYFTNLLMPEKSKIIDKVGKYTFGFGILQREEVYYSHPDVKFIHDAIDSTFRKSIDSNHGFWDYINDHYEKNIPELKSFFAYKPKNTIEAEVLSAPEKLKYKIDKNDVSQEFLDQFCRNFDLTDNVYYDFCSKIFRTDVFTRALETSNLSLDNTILS